MNDYGHKVQVWSKDWDHLHVRIARLEAALERSQLAIDDWLHLFAPELCNDDDVARSRSRVMAVGTLAYIADVQQQNRAALTPVDASAEHG